MKKETSKNKKLLFLALALTLIIIAAYFVLSPQDTSHEEEEVSHSHDEGDSLEHVHGIVSTGANTLYVATHNGLFRFQDSHFDQVGKSTDDYMSFVVHPSDPSVMYASGHSNDEIESKEDYKNLGVLKSLDGGKNWKRISKGINGPVDFHAMGISAANPNLIYGWFSGLQRSLDGGTTWEIIDAELYEVYVFEPHPTDENIVYAATAYGIMVSNDKGENWEFLSEELTRVPIISISINSQNPDIILSNTNKFGFIKTTDGGKTWEQIEETFNGELVTYITFDKDNSNIAYLITRENSIHQSNDGGETWFLVYRKEH